MVTETPGPSLMTSDSHLLNGTAAPKTNASDPNLNTDYDFDAIITRDVVYFSIILSLDIPMICLAIYAVYSLIKSKHAAPVFIINLLISDLLSIFSILLLTCGFKWVLEDIAFITLQFTGFTGVYFMTCIAVERYILIAHPIWHRSHRSLKRLVCTSLTGWLLPCMILPMNYFQTHLMFFMSFIPYAVVIVCFICSCRSLSRSTSLTPLKKQLVLGPLFFVVISYTFLILPFISVIILRPNLHNLHNSLHFLIEFACNLYVLNPLVDCLLYVFMRSDAENIIRIPLCYSRLNRIQTETGQTTSTDVQLHRV